MKKKKQQHCNRSFVSNYKYKIEVSTFAPKIQMTRIWENWSLILKKVGQLLERMLLAPEYLTSLFDVSFNKDNLIAWNVVLFYFMGFGQTFTSHCVSIVRYI